MPARDRGAAKARSEWSYLTRRVVLPVARFLHTEGLGGAALLASAAIAIAWANSPLAPAYGRVFEAPIRLQVGSIRLDGSLREAINDALMAVFFFVVTLEIKREWIEGSLADRRSAALPIAGAVGGMVAPAAIYAAINAGGPGARGWGIPTATDIAFAVGVVLGLGRRVPAEARTFLLALAVVDDLGAIAVIALFYSRGLDPASLLVAGGLMAAIAGLNRGGIRSPIVHAPLAAGLWAAIAASGLHATLAGVATALLTPARAHFPLDRFVGESGRLIARIRGSLAAGDPDRAESAMGRLEVLTRATEPALARRLRQYHPWSSFVVLPLFALANAGVPLSAEGLARAGASRVAWGVAVGLVVGKPLGVVAACGLVVAMGWARLPARVDWRRLASVGLLAGIGFTMSLFVGELAFDDPALVAEAKVATLAASIFAGLAGTVAFRLGPAGHLATEDFDAIARRYPDDPPPGVDGLHQ